MEMTDIHLSSMSLSVLLGFSAYHVMSDNDILQLLGDSLADSGRQRIGQFY